MSISFEDMSGMLVSPQDVDEAISTIGKFIIIGITTLPPELAVQMPNILRCLKEFKAIKAALEKKK